MFVPFQSINCYFHEFDRRVSDALSDVDPQIIQTILPLILDQGKRIRPALVYLSALVCNTEITGLCHRFAVVTELIHTASLFQDDVLDHAKVRRGRPSANRLLGNDTAVLVGDLLYLKALAMMTSQKKSIRSDVNNAVFAMIEAEIYQGLNRFTVLEERVYFDVIKGKTAALLALACRLGASLSNKITWINALTQYGEQLGLAFQLIDDLLDWTATNTGKDTFSDAREGRYTLPVIRLLATMNHTEKTRFLDVLNVAHLDQAIDDLQTYRDLMNNRGISSDIRLEAEKMVHSAARYLADLPESPYLKDLLDLSVILTKRGSYDD
jgi:octaprenyl-diphosphate synthase